MHTILSSYTAVQYFSPRFELEHVARKRERERGEERVRKRIRKEKSSSSLYSRDKVLRLLEFNFLNDLTSS